MATIDLDILKQMDSVEKAAQKAEDVIVAAFQQAASQSTEHIQRFANKSFDQLKQLALDAQKFADDKAAAEKAAAEKIIAIAKKQSEALSKLYNDAANEAVGALGDFKDVYENVAGSLTGMSEASVEAGVAILDTTEYAANLGKAFGPLGAAIGGTIGFVIGLKESLKGLGDEIQKTTVLGEGWLSEYVGPAAKGGAVILDQFVEWGIVSQEVANGYTVLTGETADYTKAQEELKKSLHETTEQEFKLQQQHDANLRVVQALAKLEAEWAKDEQDKQRKLKEAANERRKAEKELTDSIIAWSKLRIEAYDLEAQKRNEALAAEQEDNAFILSGGRTGDFEIDPNAGAGLLGDLAKDFAEVTEKAAKAGFVLREDWITGLQEYKDVYESLSPMGSVIGDETEIAQLEDLAFRVEELFISIGQSAASNIGNVAAGAFNDLFDSLAANEKQTEKFSKTLLRSTSAMLRSYGSELIGDGIKNELIGLGKVITTGGALGKSQMAIGALEIATGAAMGGIGVLGGRRAGKAPSEESSTSNLGRNSNQQNGPIVQTPTIVNIQSLLPNDKRSWENLASTINKAQRMAV